MLAREHMLPLAASASMLICTPMLPAASSPTIRVSMKATSYGLRMAEVSTIANKGVLPVRKAVHAAAGHGVDTFTAADMAVLDAVERVTAEDHFDYDALLDYDDD